MLWPLCISSTTLCICFLLLPCHFCRSCHVFFYCMSCVHAYPAWYKRCGLLGLHHSLLFPYGLGWCVGRSSYSSNRWTSTVIFYFRAMSMGLLATIPAMLAYWVHYLFPPQPNCFIFTSCCAYGLASYHSCHVGSLSLLPLFLGFPDLIALLLPLIVPMGLLAVISAMLAHWTCYLFPWDSPTQLFYFCLLLCLWAY